MLLTFVLSSIILISGFFSTWRLDPMPKVVSFLLPERSSVFKSGNPLKAFAAISEISLFLRVNVSRLEQFDKILGSSLIS